MLRKRPIQILPLLLMAILVLSGCAPRKQPAAAGDAATTQTALLQALAAQDTAKLQTWMTEPFLAGTWRSDLSDTSPSNALKSLYADHLSVGNHLAPVQDADLKALMGGTDPLSIPREEAGVTDALLVSGWGKDGRDEAILFFSRQADNSLKWHGWIEIQGGFSGARFGGIRPYQNDAYGYSLYLPKDVQFEPSNANHVLFLAPGEGHPSTDRAAAFISVEPANGRTAEQVATQLAEKSRAEMGAGYTGAAVTVMGIDGEPAYSVGRLPGQDINRQLFIVHNDLLYHMMFVPDDPQARAYRQMEDLYSMIVNTFNFTK